MSRDSSQSPWPDDDRIPDRLADELAGAFGAPPRVPPRLDQSIIAGARAHFARQNRFRSLLRWGGGAAAAAAVLVMAIRLFTADQPLVAPSVAYRTEDVNRDGRIDILDAYLLSRHLQSNQALPSNLDLNQDGRVDAADADVLARRVVQLEGGPL